MADLTITAANVVTSGTANIENGRAGATILAGQVVYKEASTGQFKLTDTDSGTAEVKSAYGIALHGSLSGQPLAVQTAGPITIGATLVAGVPYFASNAPGGISPLADVTAEAVAFLGMAISTTQIDLRINNTGVTAA